LQGLSPALREQVIADAAEMGIKIEHDLSWLLVGAQVRSWAAAAAAGASAEELAQRLEGLPKAMQDAMTGASKDFRGQVRAILGNDGREFLDALRLHIDNAANAGAEKLRGAAATLDGELTRKIELRKDEGVEEWGIQAANAAIIAARTAQGAVVRHSAMLVIGVLTLGILIGGGGLWAAREITGDYLPAGVQTFQSPAGSDFIRVTPGRATVGNAIQCGAD
jgi:hypothetical protein